MNGILCKWINEKEVWKKVAKEKNKRGVLIVQYQCVLYQLAILCVITIVFCASYTDIAYNNHIAYTYNIVGYLSEIITYTRVQYFQQYSATQYNTIPFDREFVLIIHPHNEYLVLWRIPYTISQFDTICNTNNLNLGSANQARVYR